MGTMRIKTTLWSKIIITTLGVMMLAARGGSAATPTRLPTSVPATATPTVLPADTPVSQPTDIPDADIRAEVFAELVACLEDRLGTEAAQVLICS